MHICLHLSMYRLFVLAIFSVVCWVTSKKREKKEELHSPGVVKLGEDNGESIRKK